MITHELFDFYQINKTMFKGEKMQPFKMQKGYYNKIIT